jgi:heme/copper-type cytochrome/quinol oxidase subunit 3
MFATAPTWLDGNVALAALLVLLVVAVAVLRFVRKTATRVALLIVLALGAGFVLSERNEFEQCGSTCECDPAGVHVTVLFCDP